MLHAALVLALATLAAAAGPRARRQIASQQVASQEARPRPTYERALAASRRARSIAGRTGWQAELVTLADELEAEAYGLGHPPDGDRVLASTITLCALAATGSERGEALREILADVESHLGSSARVDPDLALALAQGWPALLMVQTGKELALEERVAGLTFALESASSIDAADQREPLGIVLAEALHAQLLAAGAPERATEALEQWLPCFPGELVRRPFLLGQAADERRVQQAWGLAWRDLQLAEAELARLVASGNDTAHLRRTLASQRCQLELACGLIDRAVESLDRERAAVRDGANDAVSRFSLLLDVSSVALLCSRAPVVARARDELAQALAEPGPFSDLPDERAQLRARLAVLQDLREELEPGVPKESARFLEEALGETGLDDVDRAMLVLRLIRLAHRSGDRAGAERWLARLDPRQYPDAPALPPEHEIAATAWRARLALARGAERAELELHARDVQACYERSLAAWRERPERAGGMGRLRVPSRRLLLGVLIELRLALGDGHEEVIDLLLREQALGSLARRLEAQQASIAAARARLLRRGGGLLLYLPSDRTTHLFCLDAQDSEHFELPWSYAHEPALQTLGELLMNSPGRLANEERARELAAIHAHAEDLARRLLPGPVQERLARWKGAYVVGADLLGGVPFECLRVDGAELGTRVALAHLPSIPVALALAARTPEERELSVLLVAAPETGASKGGVVPSPAFPFGRAEEDALTAGFARATVLSGARATWSGLLEALGREPPRVLHVLVHGVNDAERELSGGLALAPCARLGDGLLWCEDVLATDFRTPELVLLSACGSARGPRRLGDDGLAQLGGAFLARGARCIVQAANDIALAPTVRALEAFDRRLAAGDAPAEALRAARAELAGAPGFAHPFYAQALRVLGLGLEPLVP